MVITGFFDKKKTASAAAPRWQEPKFGGNDVGDGAEHASWPWDGHAEYAACNFALGYLTRNLRERLTIDGRLHAETYVAAIGVIAGFAAQHALFQRIATTNDGSLLRQMQVVTSINGGRYFFGEPLNRMLFHGAHAAPNERLWALAAGGAVAAGLAPACLPKLEDLFFHVGQAIGSEDEGMPSVPRENFPQAPPKELLRLLWPLAIMCFTGKIPSDADNDEGAGIRLWPARLGEACVQFWPAISAFAANTIIRDVQTLLAPEKALVILMETAIYASKLDPAAIIKNEFGRHRDRASHTRYASVDSI
jgi:hypothetical protein